MNICAISGVSRVCILIRVPMQMELYSKDCDLIDAAKTRTTLHHPQGDGQVQRLNKSLVKILSKLISDHCPDWADFVPKAVLAYNTSVHELTGFTRTASCSAGKLFCHQMLSLGARQHLPKGRHRRTPVMLLSRSSNWKRQSRQGERKSSKRRSSRKLILTPSAMITGSTQETRFGIETEPGREKKEIPQALVWSLESGDSFV